MNCICCNSVKIGTIYIKSVDYDYCHNCGFLFLKHQSHTETGDSLNSHYLCDDPHENVSQSKKSFYSQALNYLSTKIKRDNKKILDIGCGYGYFLNTARKSGWQPTGIEVVQDAAQKSQKKVGKKNIIQGKLNETNMPEGSFEAITLWDVLAIVDNPYNELKESYRLLKKGGIVGIRTRNVGFQLFVYRIFNLIQKLAVRFGFKEPFVFNKYCFSAKSLQILLTRLGFTNIQIFNSPLTLGDPYNHMPFKFPVKITKKCVDIFSKLSYLMTRGRWLLAPSLLIWAQKP